VTDIKKMSFKEFRDLGFLQELNRQFLHPRGLALAVTQNENNKITSEIEIWDARDDIEGWLFDTLDKDKINRVEQEYKKYLKARNKLFSSRKGIQPLDYETKSNPT